MNWEERITIQEPSEQRKTVLYFLSFYKDVPEHEVRELIFATEQLVKCTADLCTYNDMQRLLNDTDVIDKLSVKGITDNLLDMLVNKEGLEDKAARLKEVKFSQKGESYLHYLATLLKDNIKSAVRESAVFIPHCDDPECNSGALHCTCLNCEKPLIDYEAWWKRHEATSGEEVQVDCYRCGRPMMLVKDQKGMWLRRGASEYIGTYTSLRME